MFDYQSIKLTILVFHPPNLHHKSCWDISKAFVWHMQSLTKSLSFGLQQTPAQFPSYTSTFTEFFSSQTDTVRLLSFLSEDPNMCLRAMIDRCVPSCYEEACLIQYQHLYTVRLHTYNKSTFHLSLCTVLLLLLTKHSTDPVRRKNVVYGEYMGTHVLTVSSQKL